MAETKKPVAFGYSTKRFERKGLHPDLGFTNQLNDIGPGEYQKLDDWTRRRIPGKKWTEADRKGMKDNLKFQKMKITIPESAVDRLPEERSSRETKIKSPNFGQSKSGRFTEQKSDTPGPGFYGKNHIAPLRVEEWNERRKKHGMISKTKDLTFPEYLIAPDWKMTPAQYNVKHSTSIQATVDKKISKKGPYQLFSGKRDGTSLYGYFADPKIEGEPKFYDLPEEMKRLQEPSKRYTGLWRSIEKKISRDTNGFHAVEYSRFDKKPTLRHLVGNTTFAYRDPSQPGPADYFTKPTSVSKDLVYHPPFLSSVKSPRGKTELTQCNPDATRYFLKSVEYVNGHRNVFQSKVPRFSTKK